MRRRVFGLPSAHTTVAGRRVRELGTGTVRDLPEVVLLPGLGAPGYLVPWARALALWTRATVLDLPGWRAGRATASAPSVAGVATATAAWLVATGRPPVVLLGHSTGAQAALRVAVRAPERLVGLVLGGPTFDPPARTLPGAAGRLARTLPHEAPGELLAVAPSYLASGGVGLFRFLRDGQRDRPEDRVTALRVPTLVITGEHDGVAPPAWARRLADLAGAPAVVLPGGHNAPYRFPYAAGREVQRAVQRWTAT